MSEMKRDEFLKKLASGRNTWEAVLAQVPRDRFEDPGVAGAWSVKDVIAHIAWHEREMLALLDTRRLDGSPWWLLPTDERNAHIYEENRERPLEDVLAEADAVYAQLVDALSRLEDEAFTDPSAFAEMPSDWIPADILAQNSYEHYEAHRQSLAKWLKSAS
jgi:uncharacterized damage-inducible protein DinB